MKEFASQHDIKIIIVVTAAISLILSLSQVLTDDVINSDGILYLQIAEHIQKNEWSSATKLYNWLFYPFLIAQLSNLTSLSLEQAAHLLNSLCTAIICTTFILIIKEFGGKEKATLWFASLIILCYPNMNEYRDMIIRDHGYWAFYLLSCLYFLKAYQQIKVKTLIALITFLVIATLFRVEGLIFTLILPLFLLTWHIKIQKNRIRALFQIVLITSVTLLAYHFISSNDHNIGYTKTTQIYQAIESSFYKIKSSVDITENYINKLSVHRFSENYAPTVLGFVFLLILATEIFSATSALYVFALISSFFVKRGFLSNYLIKPWGVLIIINLIILCGFLLSAFFLTGRYPIALSLILLIPIPFFLNVIYQQIKVRQISPFEKKLLLASMILFAIVSVDGVVSFGTKKSYLKDTGVWISANMNPDNENFYTNNLHVNFYAGTQSGQRIKNKSLDTVLNDITTNKLSSFNIMAIQVSRKSHQGLPRLVNALNSNPVKTFHNKAGDSVYIFKL